MRIIWVLILVCHGLIHFIGFAKAFDLGTMAQFTKHISKPLGLLWLLTGSLFIISGMGYLIKKEAWPVLALLAVVGSQLLIFIFWKDAKFGTLPNMVILISALVALGTIRFKGMVQKESEGLLQNILLNDASVIAETDVTELPANVQKWIQNAGVMGKEKIVSVRLRQKGQMKTKPNGKWMRFTAAQYFDVLKPAFVWSTEVEFMPWVKLMGRDKFTNGSGEMIIKLAGLFPVAQAGDNQKINSGTMIRYLAETVWFPSAALNDYIHWEPLNTLTSKATFELHGQTVSGVFRFTEKGDITSFEAKRFYGADQDAELETWAVKLDEYKSFEGIRIPTQCEVIWKLEEGDFHWLNFTITDLEYNNLHRFEE